MNATKTKPTGGNGGPPMGHSVGGRALLSGRDDTPVRPARQIEESPYVAHLRRVAELAKAEDDREGYWLARRLFLLAQAAAYQAGEVGR